MPVYLKRSFFFLINSYCTLIQAEIDSAVADLLALKKEYKELTGEDPPRADGGSSRKKDKKKSAAGAGKQPSQSDGGASGEKKKKDTKKGQS